MKNLKKIYNYVINNINKKHFITVLFVLLISAALGFLSTNYKSIMYDHSIRRININDIEYENFKVENNKLVATDDNAKIKILNTSYIKKIRFNYYRVKNGNLNTFIEYGEKNKGANNSNLTNLFVENINEKADDISLTFNQKLVISNIIIDNSFSFNFYMFFLIFTVLLIFFYYKWNKEYFSKNIHKLFLLIAIPMGLLLTLESSPIIWTGLDDDYHFGVTYQLCRINDRQEWGENAVLSRTAYVNFLLFNTPEETLDGVKQIDNLTTLKTTDRSFPVTFSSITYIPASLVLNTILAVGLPFSTAVLFAKLVNLFIYIIVIYYAIKTIPKYKHLLMFISLIPTSLYIAGQFSYDSKVNALLLLMLAFIIKELFDKKNRINKKTMLAIILFGIIGASAKGIYILLILPALVIPKEKFNSKRECYVFRVLVLLSIVFIFSTFMGTSLSSADTRLNPTASAPNQISNIIHHPNVLFKAYYNSAFQQFFLKLFGNQTLTSLGSYGFVVSNNIYYIILFTLLILTLVDISGVELKLKDRVAFLTSSFLLICLIWGALYLSFTAVGADHIDGVQGRYFVVLLLPLLMCLSQKKQFINISELKISDIIVYSTLVVLAVSLFENIIKFYCI